MTQPEQARVRQQITGAEFQQLRRAMGLTTQELAQLIGCAWGTLRNIEAHPQQQVNSILTLLMTLLSDPAIRAQIPQLLAQQQALCQEKAQKKGENS